MQRCTICRGTKKVMGMGAIAKSCESCKGIGYIEAAKVIDSPKINVIAATVTIEDQPKPAKIDGRKLYWEKKRQEKLAQLSN